jgi:hypothetical protein
MEFILGGSFEKPPPAPQNLSTDNARHGSVPDVKRLPLVSAPVVRSRHFSCVHSDRAAPVILEAR